MQRYARQTILPEIGRAGQARIAETRVDVALEGLAAEVAIRYLVGAGVRRLRVRTPSLAAIAHALDPAVAVEVTPALEVDRSSALDEARFEDPAARAVGGGAFFALRALRSALRGSS